MAETIAVLIASGGYASVFALMVIENIFPPIPSEVILPFVGFSVADGTLAPLPALLAATAGSVVGTGAWFLVGWSVPTPRLRSFFIRYGAYVAISVEDFDRATAFFTKYQVPAVLFGRMVPTVRTVVSIPAGSVRMPWRRFFFYTIAGTLVWNSALIGLGYMLYQDFARIGPHVDFVANVVLACFVGVYLFQVLRFHRARRNS